MTHCSRYECFGTNCTHTIAKNQWKHIGNMNFGTRKTIADMRPSGKE